MDQFPINYFLTDPLVGDQESGLPRINEIIDSIRQLNNTDNCKAMECLDNVHNN